ncbi:hypothetical protein DICSQDRAFT_171036 [Dichomitus squalens LYAD-421 SS1]|uniref:Glycosyl hydrolase n=1 Tax=Dichomitus squalens (strain LYAD-421) TaxID=732165 RepID=R7SXZ7_DICSQ|nr:uncharacterized protein DICSQDRAFT_171036 [Dichomitus squalens LYAD-421 SS1]EJF60595.1 hypothetical protein DICSQDRAFT_171036 [Dichomitus squalens LYAD-421 SS1]
MISMKSLFWTLLSTVVGGRALTLPDGSVLLDATSDVNGRLWRPQVHFSPPSGFMNDPNGLHIDENGIYHLYYQYNPTCLTGGNQHWGHATSQDLYHWVDQPIAISPPDPNSLIWSGSAIVNVNNTSGLFSNQTNGVVAIYTLNNNTAGRQVQEIAYSLDGGYTFTRYSGNPVINVNSNSFRDPKVFWHAATQRWVVVVAHSNDLFLEIYTSPDLKNWTSVSTFSRHGFLGFQYECPNLVRIPLRDASGAIIPTSDDTYVLTVSVSPGTPLGGSTIQYFPGTFNGSHFTPVDDATRFVDIAQDNYAAQFFYGLPDGDDALLLGWASNTAYTNLVPTAQEGWRGAHTIPRRLFLTNSGQGGWDLVSLPANISAVFDPSPSGVIQNSFNGSGTVTVDLSAVTSNAYYFEVNVTGLQVAGPSVDGTDLGSTLAFTLSSPTTNESVSGGFLFGLGSAYLDRSHTNGFQIPLFTDKFSTTAGAVDGMWTLSAVWDRSILELFLGGGVQSATALAYPQEPLTQFTVNTHAFSAGAVVNVTIYALESVWSGNGTRTIPTSPVIPLA